MTETRAPGLRGIIIKGRSWFSYLWRKKLLILVGVLVGAGIGMAYNLLTKPKYTGSLSFVLYTDNKLSGMSALASQFGLDINMGSNGAFDGDNITGLLTSQRILLPVLLNTPKAAQTSLLNTYVATEGLLEKWKKKSRLASSLPFPAQKAGFTPLQDSLLLEASDYFLKHNLQVDKIDKKLNYYRVRVKTHDPVLSVHLTNFIVNEASHFYIDTKTKMARQNLAMITREADSLSNLMRGILVNNASNTDVNLNPAYMVARTPLQQGQLRLNAVGLAYGEVIKNLEIAKITLQKETPLYQVIDEPLLPLKKEKTSMLVSVAAGAVVAGFIMVVLLLLALIYRNVMSSSN